MAENNFLRDNTRMVSREEDSNQVPEPLSSPDTTRSFFPARPGIPETPIAPGGIRPAFPGFPNIPVTPAIPVLPSFPQRPPFPPAPRFGSVRFLNASADSFPVDIYLDNFHPVSNSRFGQISNYERVADGFHTVTIRRATGIRTNLLQRTYPIAAGVRTTMVLIDTGNGLDLIPVADSGCSNVPFHTGCYRVANMASPGSSYSFMLYGGSPVFLNVRFPSVTPYKQAVAGSYQFYVTESGFLPSLREIPVILIGAFTQASRMREPLLSYEVNIRAGQKYTTYLIGNNRPGFSLRALTVAD